MMGSNALERTEEDWVKLFFMADERFKVRSITTPPQSVLSLIEVVWQGDLGK
jgi:hypothetical protein